MYFCVFLSAVILYVFRNFAEKMKKILVILILLSVKVTAYSYVPDNNEGVQHVVLIPNGTHSNGNGGQSNRSPVYIPDVLYANNSLYFDDSQTGCMFEIYDESENVIITDYVPSNSVCSLPDDINGELTLVLYIGNYAFEGVIYK